MAAKRKHLARAKLHSRPAPAPHPPAPPYADEWADLQCRLQSKKTALLAADLLRASLETHIVLLRQANEQLVISNLRAQAMGEEIRRSHDQLGHMAHFDFLTDLPNRQLLGERLEQAINRARRESTRFAVLFIDLDRFKVINDSLGHAVGDAVLRLVAQRLLAAIRASDTASRQGGDEFVVLLSEVHDESVVAGIVEKICASLSLPYIFASHVVHVGATIGISMFPEDGSDAQMLVGHADVAMYHAKKAGRGNYQFYLPAMNERAVERQQIEVDLHRALANGEFSLHYQPKVDLGTAMISGAEALLRWTSQGSSPISPDRFIPVAEECGLIIGIGHWVLRQACQQAQAWRLDGLPFGVIAVNISALEFRDEDFISYVGTVLLETGLPSACLQLEITETVLMHDVAATKIIFAQLKALGVSLAVDDFGTGYSSLSYLSRFPIDVLKIDQSFVRNICASHGDGPIVSAIIAMGNSLGQRVIAEGIENEDQLSFLRQHHCDEGQGNFFSRPLAPAAFAHLLTAQPLPGAIATEPGRHL